jgi:hypothetical protein
MDRIPAIGGTRGIFEILIPGVFLLLNLLAAAHQLPATAPQAGILQDNMESSLAVSGVVLLTFGYLLGVLLRILRSDAADTASALFLRIFLKRGRGMPSDKNQFTREKFPYQDCIRIGDWLPNGAKEFYRTFWTVHDEGARKRFLNFCKLVITVSSEKSAAEIYAAESLSRFISSMFYGLLIATTAWMAVVAVNSTAGFQCLVGAYLMAIVAILRNYRLIRLKEVETIFTIAYVNRELFLGMGTTTPKARKDPEGAMEHEAEGRE